MAMGRPKAALVLHSELREQLESLANSRSVTAGRVRRAKIVLLSASGKNDREIAQQLETSRNTVGLWRRRFLAQGVSGLCDELRPGRPGPINDERVAQLVRKTLKSKPKAATHWSIRQIADETGVSKSTVHRNWQAFGLQPHRQKHFKLSNDPFFVEKGRDIVGLYLNPPENAVVLCVDEKSGIQALERTRQNLEVHRIVDNYATHKHPRVRRWFATRPRFHVHFTPNYASWLNQVEIWFNRVTQQAIRRGTFSGVKELLTKIDHYVQNSNRHGQPFVWTATADSIFAKVERLCERIYGTAHQLLLFLVRQCVSGKSGDLSRSLHGAVFLFVFARCVLFLGAIVRFVLQHLRCLAPCILKLRHHNGANEPPNQTRNQTFAQLAFSAGHRRLLCTFPASGSCTFAVKCFP